MMSNKRKIWYHKPFWPSQIWRYFVARKYRPDCDFFAFRMCTGTRHTSLNYSRKSHSVRKTSSARRNTREWQSQMQSRLHAGPCCNDGSLPCWVYRLEKFYGVYRHESIPFCVLHSFRRLYNKFLTLSGTSASLMSKNNPVWLIFLMLSNIQIGFQIIILDLKSTPSKICVFCNTFVISSYQIAA